ncbi:hypothetical protein TWF718_010168 [Orbilia javanica]|uniref:Methyltransferase domain-containing protein n=1 Tax=Orbilia javanica TaxID=47235 RepID=A0AAN8RDS0_9PEZI
MRICILRAAPGKGDDPPYSDIPLFTDSHTFEQRFIKKDTIKQDLNSAAAESFDLYFNFLHWNWLANSFSTSFQKSTDNESAVAAAKYIEYLALPVIGLPSRIVEQYYLDDQGKFVLSNVEFPECNEPMVGGEYSCTVVELDNTPIPLSPVFTDTGLPLNADSNINLFNAIQRLAENTFYANDFHGTFWCTLLFRVTARSEPILTGINLMPKAIFPFTAGGKNLAAEARAVRESYPGGYRSLMHSLIASLFLKRNRNFEASRKVGHEYDGVAPKYDAVTAGIYHDGVKNIVGKYKFDGLVLDVACGTGLVARYHGNPRDRSRYVGIDVSLQMRTECTRNGLYSNVLVGPMQRILITYKDPVDHIICLGAFHYLESNELSLVLSRMFQLAELSVTFTIDEIPDSYRESQSKRGREYMVGFNHLDEVERYGTPVGWKLVDRWRYLGWTSPTTGDEVYSNVFRFEVV